MFWHKRIHYFLVLLIACALSSVLITPVFIVLLCINWVAEGNFKKKFSDNKNKSIAFLFCSLLFVYMIGLLHTTNMQAGWFDIQVKCSLFIFPLLLASSTFTKKERETILLSFIIGCFIAVLICLTNAVYRYFVFSENNFFYESFSNIIHLHPSYFSMFLNTANAFLLLYSLKNQTVLSKSKKVLIAFIVLFFAIIIALLSSKMGIITLILLVFLYFIFYIIQHKKIIFGLAGIGILILLFFTMLKFVPEIKGRIYGLVSVVSDKNSITNSDSESTGVRILVWGATKDVIKEHFWTGAGTGDVKAVLMEKYKQKGLTGAYEHQLNSHNQYLQTFATLGIFGFLILLANFFIPIYIGIKRNKKMYLIFLMIIMLNFLSESMLERQAGVMFYAFFNSFLFFNFETE